MLLAAAGLANAAMARRLGSAQHQGTWRKRFCTEGLDGLADRGGGRLRTPTACSHSRRPWPAPIASGSSHRSSSTAGSPGMTR